MSGAHIDDDSWIAHPNARPAEGSVAAMLVANRDRLRVVSEEALGESYEFDDWAIVKLGREYYLLNTSGCSCPDPRDLWSVLAGPAGSVKALRKAYEADPLGFGSQPRALWEVA